MSYGIWRNRHIQLSQYVSEHPNSSYSNNDKYINCADVGRESKKIKTLISEKI